MENALLEFSRQDFRENAITALDDLFCIQCI